jgi:hypothetical protein
MIKLPSYFLGFNSKSDGSAGLRFGTQEILPEDFSELKKHQNAFGWLIFSENKDENIPEENAVEDGLSASEILRKRMFVYWKNKINDGDFDLWRKQQLNVLGERYLDKLN